MRSKFFLIVMVWLAMAVSGCGDYWEDQGAAARAAAQAKIGQAEAARQNAQAAIIDAEARGALAESQSRALTSAMGTNSDLVREAVSLADTSEYTYLIAGLLLAVIVFLMTGMIILARRQPTIVIHPSETVLDQARMLPRAIYIETPAGAVAVEQEDGETRSAYMERVRLIADQLNSRMISAPRR